MADQPLSEEQRDLLIENRACLVQHIDVHSLLTVLIAKRVIDFKEKGRIENAMRYDGCHEAGAERLLDMMMHKTQRQFQDFCDSLTENNQGFIVNNFLTGTDVEKEKYFAKLAKNIGYEWGKIATFLDIHTATQERLKDDHKDNLEVAIKKMFILWLRRERQTKSLEKCGEKLVHALKQGGRNDLTFRVGQQFKQFAENEEKIQQENDVRGGLI